jgi:hypothetical protein
MNDDILQSHLQRTEANIARGRRCIERTQLAVMEQKLKGHDAKEAEKLVSRFESK